MITAIFIEMVERAEIGISRRDLISIAGLGSAALWLNSCSQLNRTSDRTSYKSPDEIDWQNWDDIRNQYLLDPAIAHLNTGTLGPAPKPVFDALVERMRRIAQDPNMYHYGDNSLMKQIDKMREPIASFVGATADEIAFTRNTTEGLNVVAHGLELKSGDEIIITDNEHPANINCWNMRAKRDGIKLKIVKMPAPPKSEADMLNRIEEAITKQTRLISVSHVTCTNGMRLPAKEICKLARKKGIFSMVDGAQALGMLDFSIADMDCDFYANSPHKWMGTPQGTGFFYIRKDLIEKVWPLISGSWEDKTAKKYESVGTRNFALDISIKDGIDFQNKIGKSRIEARGAELALYLKSNLAKIDGVTLLTSLEPGLSSSLSAFTMKDIKAEQLYAKLFERHKIRTRLVGETNALRIATHYFNTYPEIDRLLDAIEDVAKHGIGKVGTTSYVALDDLHTYWPLG